MSNLIRINNKLMTKNNKLLTANSGSSGLAYNNNLLKFNNYVIGSGSTPVPPGPSDYKLVLTVNDHINLNGFNPNVTSGTLGDSALNQAAISRLNNTERYHYYTYYNGYGDLTIIIANVSVNTLSFMYKISTEGDSANYTLYRTVNGVDTQISSGTLPQTYEMTEYTLNLT